MYCYHFYKSLVHFSCQKKGQFWPYFRENTTVSQSSPSFSILLRQRLNSWLHGGKTHYFSIWVSGMTVYFPFVSFVVDFFFKWSHYLVILAFLFLLSIEVRLVPFLPFSPVYFSVPSSSWILENSCYYGSAPHKVHSSCAPHKHCVLNKTWASTGEGEYPTCARVQVSLLVTVVCRPMWKTKACVHVAQPTF